MILQHDAILHLPATEQLAQVASFLRRSLALRQLLRIPALELREGFVLFPDLRSYLGARLPLSVDLSCGGPQERIPQQIHTSGFLLDHGQHRSHRCHAFEFNAADNLCLDAVLEHVDQLAIAPAELVWVQDLVSAANLKDCPEEVAVLRKAALHERLLGNVKVVGNDEARNNGAHLLDLQCHASSLVARMINIHLVCVLRYIECTTENR
mmetsp:Transcript_105591/g.192051  ORF Transcript_105591/g.192051 Transcript_105591/m.192051 type:complete len:209 (+) Transcript_105591:896-1522(+)